MRRSKKLLVVATAALPFATAKAAEQTVTYTAGTSSNWNNAGNWSLDLVPNNGGGNIYDVVITGGSSSTPITVTDDVSVTINNLQVDANNILGINDNQQLHVNGNIVDNGTIQLNSTGDGTYLMIGGTTTLSGTGTLQLGSNGDNIIQGASTGNESLIISSGFNVTGGGRIGNGFMQLTNHGTINANLNGVAMGVSVSSAGGVNTGTMEASNGGTLNISGTFTNTGGTIEALTGSTVNLSGTTITGGTITTAGTGGVTMNNSTLSGLTNGGSIALLDNTNNYFSGTITDNGTITMASTGDGTNFRLTGNVTLGGTGSLMLNNHTQNQIFGSTTGNEILTNGASHTIEGAGQIGLAQMGLINNGIINANQSQSLTINPGGANSIVNTVTNGGTMEATAGGTLVLVNGTFTNNNVISASGTGSTVLLSSGLTVVGGSLQTSGGGQFLSNNGAVLQGVTLAGTLNESDNSNLYLSGSLVNNGSLNLNSTGDGTNLQLLTNISVTGTGTINLSNHTQNQLLGGVTGHETLTLGSGQTLQGSGGLGIGAMNLTNNGTIDANVSNSLNINPGSGNAVTNNATVEATNSGTLNITGTFNNGTNGVISETGSTVNFNNASVTGGSLSGGTGNGFVEQGSTTFTNVTLASGTVLGINDNTNTYLSGTITNNGTVNENSTGDGTNIQIVGNVGLAGTGTWNLSNHTQNQIYGQTGTETLTVGSGQTIQGSGNIGIGQLNLINNGHIIANISGNSLALQPGGSQTLTNNATLEATNSGILNLNQGTFANGGGTILANNGTVNINNAADVVGGNLTSNNGGQFVSTNAGVLDGVTLTSGSTLGINDNTDLYLKDGITNNGTIKENSTGDDTNVILLNSLTLTGTGSLVMSNHNQNRIYGQTGAEVLTVDTHQTIEGSGQLGVGTMGLINNGTINADVSSGLYLQPTSNLNFTNNATMEATAGGTLQFNSGTYINNATISAAAGSLVNLANGASITGGTLSSTGTGVVQNSGGVTLTNVTNAGTGAMTYVDNSTNYLSGTFTNNGQVQENSTGDNTDVELLGSAVTINGTGTWTMSNHVQNRLYGQSGATVLTLGSGATIQGSGQIGAGQLDMINNGTIDANASGGLIFQPSGGTNNFTNNGTWEATAGGTLQLNVGTYINNTTITAATGSLVRMTGSVNLSGGTLAGAGTFEETGGVTIANLTNNSTINLDDNSTNYFATGTIVNNGQINQNSTGDTTDAILTGNVTFNGTGTYTLSSHIQNRLYGQSGTTELTNGAGHTINGGGQIGAGQLELDNFGTIDATVSTPIDLNPSAATTATNEASGIFRGSGSAGLQLLAANFNNLGTVVALDGSNVTYASNATTVNNVSGVLTNGKWEALSTAGDPATVTMQGNAITQIAANTTVELLGSGSVIQAVSTPIDSTLTGNAGTLSILSTSTTNVRNFETSNALANTGTIQLGGGILAPTSLTNSGGGSKLAGYGTVTPLISNAGTVEAGQVTADGFTSATTGTLTATNGIQGPTGTIKIDSGFALDLSHATAASTTGTLTHDGTNLNLGSNNILVSTDYNNASFGTGNSFNNHGNVTGSGSILASAVVDQSISGAAVTGGTTGSPTINLGQFHTGAAAQTLDYQINVTDPNGPGPGLRGAVETSVHGGSITDSRLSGSGVTASNWGVTGPITPGNPTPDLAITFSPSSAGVLTGQSIHIANNFDNVAGQTVSLIGAVYNLATPTVTPGSTNAHNVHLNQAVSQAITVGNTSPNNGLSEQLDVTVGTPTNGSVSSSSPFTVLPGSSNSGVTLSLNTSHDGAQTGSVSFGLQSDAANVAGDNLGKTTLTSQSASISATVWNLASALVPTSAVNIGSYHVNDTATGTFNVTNNAPSDGFSEKLDGQITGINGDLNSATVNGGSSFNLLAAQSSEVVNVAINTSSAGSKSGQVTFTFQSDGQASGTSGNSGLGITDLAGQSVTVQATVGNVFRLANPVIQNTQPINLTDVHVGQTDQTHLSVLNQNPNDGFSENLDATVGPNTGDATSSGTISLLGAGSTSTNLAVGVNAATAGHHTGTVQVNFTSDSSGVAGDNLGTTPLNPQTVTVNGNAYRLANPTAQTATPINLGFVHVNQTVNTTVSVQNNVANDGFSENLNGAAAGQTGAATATGSFSGILPGHNGTLGITLNTSNPGAVTGTASFSFASNGNTVDSLGITPLTGQNQTYTVNATVNQFANPEFTKAGGNGGLTEQNSTHWTLDLGNLLSSGGSSTALDLVNNVSGQADSLSGNWTLPTGILSLVNFGTFSGIAPGAGLSNNLMVNLAAGAPTGVFTENVTLNPSSDNPSFDTALNPITLEITGNVQGTSPIPEPTTFSILAMPAAMLLLRRRRARLAARISYKLEY